jgi:hypothetical protein
MGRWARVKGAHATVEAKRGAEDDAAWAALPFSRLISRVGVSALLLSAAACSSPAAVATGPDAAGQEAGRSPPADAGQDTAPHPVTDSGRDTGSPPAKDATTDTSSHPDTGSDTWVPPPQDAGHETGPAPDASSVCVFDNPASTFDGKCTFGN